MAAAKTTLTLFVHSVAPGDFAAKGTVGGKTMDVTIPGVVVELVSDDESMSQTLRLQADDAAAFDGAKEGDEVTVTYTRNAD